MLFKGDYVTHNTFPPVEGYVAVIENRVGVVGPSKVAVMNKETGNLFWDSEDTWEIVKGFDEDDVIEEDIIDVECVEVDSE